MMEKKLTAQEPQLFAMTRRHVPLTNAILFLDASSNIPSTTFANLDANVLTMLTAKNTKRSTNWQTNASRQFVMKDWEHASKFLQARNAESREENAKMTVLQLMLVMLQNVSNLEMNSYANIPLNLATMELNAPKILAMQSKDASTPTLSLKNANQIPNVPKILIVSHGDSLKNLERNVKRQFATRNSDLVLLFQRKEIASPLVNVPLTAQLKTFARLHTAN